MHNAHGNAEYAVLYFEEDICVYCTQYEGTECEGDLYFSLLVIRLLHLKVTVHSEEEKQLIKQMRKEEKKLTKVHKILLFCDDNTRSGGVQNILLKSLKLLTMKQEV